MPDWREVEEYSYTESLTLHQWAWEFLRRNPDYRADWASLQDRMAGGELVAGNDATTPVERQAYSVNLGLAARWDLYLLSDPDIPSNKPRFSPHFQYTTDVSILQGDTGQGSNRDGVLWAHAPYNPALRFNLLVPIQPQLEVARKILTHLRRRLKADEKVRHRTGKPQADKFPLYLRVLDARLARESESEVGRVLFRESFEPRLKARAAIKAAQKMTSSGYRDLLLTPDTWTRLPGESPK